MPPRISLCLLLLFSLASGAQQPSAPASTTTPKFQISGTVVHAQTGEPLAQTRITLGPPIANSRDQFPDLQSVMTGEDGRFLFKNVPPGKYALVAEHRGFPRQAFDEHEYFSSAIVAGPGKVSENLVFRLLPEGSISGKVSDEEGDPVENCQVMLFEKRIQNGEQGIFMQSQISTDDQGLYHFGHLRSGSYFVAVTAQPWYARFKPQSPPANPEENTSSQANNNAEFDRAFPVTYYPAADDPSGASPITIQPGSQLTADITLRSVPALHLRLANTNLDSSQNMQVTMTQSIFGHPGYMVNAQTMRTGGNTEVTGFAPGHYDINLQTYTRNPDNKSGTWNNRRQAAAVLRDGEIDASKGEEPAQVSGIVEFEGSPSPPATASIQLFNHESSQGQGNRIQPDGKFESFTVAPGRYEVFVPNSAGFFVKSLAADGAKISGRMIEIKDPGSIQLAVVVSKGAGAIDGIVLRDEKPVAGAMVVLVPQDPQNNASLFRRDQSDSDGTFSLRGVLPGKYTALAIQNGWDLEWSNPAVLQRYMAKGETGQVEPKGKYNLVIQLQ